MQINSILRNTLNVQCILALTATATKQTELSVCSSLLIPIGGVVRAPLSRPNLSMSVSRDSKRMRALVSLLRSGRIGEGSVIVYCMRQKQAAEVAQYLLVSAGLWTCFVSGRECAFLCRVLMSRLINSFTVDQ